MLDSRWVSLAAVLFFVGSVAFAVYTRTAKDIALPPSALLDCFSKGGESQICLQQTVDTLLRTRSTAELMHYIVASTSPDRIRLGCHAVAHVIGVETYKRTGNMETALGQCTDECSLGCWHGVIVASVVKDMGSQSADDLAHADSAEIQTVGAKYCAQGRKVCHAVGHVLYASVGNIQNALRSCESVASGDSANACFQGVYMEAFQNSFASSSMMSADDSHANDLAYPCDTISAKYQHTCFFYLPTARKERSLLQNTTYPERVRMWHETCGTLPTEKMRSDCFLGFGLSYEMYTDADGNLAKNRGTQCTNLSGIERDSCVVGVSLSYAGSTEYRDGLSYCFSLSSAHEKSLCYDAAFQTRNRFSENEKASAADCDTLPDPAECSAAFSEYSKHASSVPDYFAYGFFK